MPEEKSIADRLRDAQVKIKQFANTRDQLMREVGAEEQKLEEAYNKLRELGVENAETKSLADLHLMVSDLEALLAFKLEELEGQITEGEALMTKFQELQNG